MIFSCVAVLPAHRSVPNNTTGMNNEAPKDYDQSPGQIKSLRRLPKTCTFLLKLLAASCVMDSVGATTPFITAAGSSPTTCECSQAIASAVADLRAHHQAISLIYL